MTRPSLPSSLRPRVSDYGFDSPAGSDSSAVEGGVNRYGLAYESAAQIFSVTLILDLYEFSVWNLFYLRKTALGTITFDMVLDSGHGLAPHACNIVTGSYSAKRTAGNAGMVVTFQVQAESQAFEFLDADVDAQLAVFEVFGRQGPGMLIRIGVFANSDTLAFADFPAVNMVTADVDPAITFTRAGAKTYFDQAGILRTAAANVWPLEYHPVTRRALGRRVEPASTNKYRFSRQLDNAAWVKSAAAVVANAGSSADGTTSMEKLKESATIAASYANQSEALVVGQVKTISAVVASSGDSRFLQFLFPATGFSANRIAVFNVETGAFLTNSALVTARSTPLGGGRCRIEATCVATLNVTVGVQVRLATAFAATTQNSVGNNVSGLLIDNLQSEDAAVAGSIIDTDSVAVSRPPEVVQLNVPAGKSTLTYSFSDGTTTTVAVTAGSVHTVPDTFFPKYITRMVWG